MRIEIEHETTYRYELPPRRVIQLLRLTPSSFDGQNVGDWSIDLNCDARLVRGRDAHGNITHLLTVDGPPETLVITSRGIVDTADMHGSVDGLDETLSPTVYLRPTELTRADEDIRAFARESMAGADNPLARAHALLAAIYERMTFDTTSSQVTTTAAEAYRDRAGVCQDLAHLFCAAARSVDLPARYVSGHLYRRDGQNDQSAAHAWAEAHVEDLGWVSFDPAHGISTDDHYVRLACGMDYLSAAPIVGSRTGGGAETLSVTARTRSNSQAQRQVQGDSSQSQSVAVGDRRMQKQQQQQQQGRAPK